MACSSTLEKDHFLCPKDPQKTNEDRSSSRLDNDDRGPRSKKLRTNTYESKDLFRKNVSTNKKKMKDESASGSRSMTRRTPSIPLVPPAFGGGSRRVSFLERSLFSGIQADAVLPAPCTTEQSKTAQLTIFYAGVVNVYDDVPADQAQAIMLFASQSPSSHPTTKDLTKADQVVKAVPGSNSPSFCKTQEDLPIARRQSLKRFLDKRRDRIISKYSREISNDR